MRREGLDNAILWLKAAGWRQVSFIDWPSNGVLLDVERYDVIKRMMCSRRVRISPDGTVTDAHVDARGYVVGNDCGRRLN